jgi:hypothetical protein
MIRKLLISWCRGSELNRHDPFESQDFKSYLGPFEITNNSAKTRSGAGFSGKNRPCGFWSLLGVFSHLCPPGVRQNG